MTFQTVLAIDKVEMKIIAVGQEIDRMAFGAQRINELQPFCRQFIQHGHPSLYDFIGRRSQMAILLNLREESLRRDHSSLKVRH